MDGAQLADQSLCTDEKFRCNGVFDCKNKEDEENCSTQSTASSSISPSTPPGSTGTIIVSEAAIWTLVVSIIVVFLLVALIIWLKFKRDRDQSNKRQCNFDQDPASDRVASIDRMRRQRNQNIERPESYHYNSRPSSMIYIGSQDNMRSISSQLSWYSQQLYPIPQRPDGSLSLLNAPVLLPHTTTIDTVNEINDTNTTEVQLDTLNNDESIHNNTDSPRVPTAELGNMRSRTTGIPASPPPNYDDYFQDENSPMVASEPLGEDESYEVSSPSKYSDSDPNGRFNGHIDNDTSVPLRLLDPLATPPPTYTDSLSYNLIS